MTRENRRLLYLYLVVLVPFLTLFSFPWLSIGGVSPRWAELWLLPFALEEGPLAGLVAGLCLGLVLDSINLDGTSQIPSLIFLGYLWGRLGRKRKYTDEIFQLGIFSWFGAFFNGLLIWFQEIFLVKGAILIVFNSWALHTLLSASILNGLIAPLLCSLSLKMFYTAKT